MNKRLLLIGYNFYPELTGIGKYSGEMIYWLAENGYDCTVVTAYPYYPYWKIQEPYFKKRFWYSTEEKIFESGGRITVHRCPMYVPSNPSGAKRVLLDLSFSITAFFKILRLLIGEKFAFVLAVAPSFQFGLLGVLYKKIRNAKLLYHIQDMQIEAARDLKLIQSNYVISTLFKIEKFIFNNCDTISSISDGMVDKIHAKAKKPIILFPNWSDTALFYPIADRNALKKDFGFDVQDTIILYSGAIGEKQGLESIVYAANEFKEDKRVKFVICGSGPYKQKLQDLVASLSLQNVIFFPLQSFDKFNQFLNIGDVHLVIQKSNASDLVMPSKLTTILSIGGLVLITASEESSLYSLVEKYEMGLLVKPENQQALNDGIQNAISTNNSYIRNNARAYAETYLSIDKIMVRFKQESGIELD